MTQEGETKTTAACGAAGAPNETKDEATSTGKIRVSFKVSGGTQFTLDVDEQWTVKVLKERCAEKANIPVAAQRLIYKGRILKDGDLISSQGVKDGHIMHLVKSAAATSGAAAPTAATSQGSAPTPERPSQASASVGGTVPGAVPGAGALGGASMESLLQSMLSGGMGGMDGLPGNFGAFPQVGGPEMAQMLQSPSFQQTLDSLIQNPQMLRSIMENVPSLRPMMPMIQVLLDDPERLRALFNPQMAQASLQMQQAMQQMRQNSASGAAQQSPQVDGASGPGAEATPGIPPAFLAAMRNMQAGNFAQGATDGTSGTPTSTGIPQAGGLFGSPGPAGADFAAMMQRASQVMQQNPELVNQMMQTMMGGGNNPLAGMGAFGFPPADSRPPEERFASQLQALSDMGFIDRDANIAALRETNGDVNAAITRLLERGLGN